MKKKKRDSEFLNQMSKNPANWKGPFYVNRKDPRLIVPKYNPEMGWTFNFASPYSYVVLIAIILVIILSQIFF